MHWIPHLEQMCSNGAQVCGSKGGAGSCPANNGKAHIPALTILTIVKRQGMGLDLLGLLDDFPTWIEMG